ncbi:MAG: PQQ-binding-like beta-propeller repeat protein [Planctomycetota bacterium]|jgi:outer membrane protein assembly factor BamB|nr:PQQ-binding-like beta-propeller repeat protein [Planctomycetota bacterium]
MMNAKPTVCTASFCALAFGTGLSGGELAKAIQSTRLTNGVILLVNTGSETYDEAADTGCTVRGLETDLSAVEASRKRFMARGIYGRLSVAGFNGKTLPCIDNLVNIVVVENGEVTKSEVMRVLAPNGTALVKTKAGWETHVKPWPPEMGEWNQYLHGADNNGVARDSAGPPERLQWTAGSRYGRVKVLMPSVTSLVTANGRIFTAEDVATVESAAPRKQYVLLARDAFNGCELWRRPLKEWDKEKLGPVKIIPVQLQRLLVAVGDWVYCTDGYDGPVTVFDGATGEVLSTFAGTGNTREIAHANRVIYGIKGQPYAYGVRRRRTAIKDLDIHDVTLFARDAASGKSLWEVVVKGSKGGKEGYIGGTLSIKGNHLTYITRTQLVCRNSRTGSELWSRDYPFWEDMPRKGVLVLAYHNSPPTIVMTHEQIFVAELDRVKAYAVADGALLWEGRTECNYTKNGDLFYAGGLVWNGFLEGLDPTTGAVKRKVTQKRSGPMVHPRCYRNRITHKYYINSKTGGTDLLALDGNGEFPSPWMRATCGLAMTPSYGRLYSSPYVCACEIGTMLLGFNCTYTETRDKNKVKVVEPVTRLVKGPAYTSAPTPKSENLPKGSPRNPKPTDWPTYRHDNARSGVTATAIPEQLKVVWKASLPAQATAPVIANGLLLTAVRSMHTVYALDSLSGEPRWQFTADGPVDSAPTCYGRLVLFGSRDGWVYCLDGQTGNLVWKFSDMPAVRLMCAMEQLESAWPVNGSVMVKDGLAYFAAGRNSFLDGGIVVYALNPETGEVVHRRAMAGPYDKRNFPRTQPGFAHRSEGSKSGIFSAEGGNLYIRHQGFKPDLTPISPYDIKKPHLMASTGFLCAAPQHRTYWTIDTELSYGPGKGYDTDGPNGDIIVVAGDVFYEVRGDAPGRHTGKVTDPLKKYRVVSGRARKGRLKRHRDPLRTSPGGPLVPSMGRWDRRWTTHIPMAGHAILVGGKTVAVAGAPMRKGYGPRDIEAAYEGRKGGLLWTLDAEDGTPLGELALPAPPVWDGLAAAGGHVYLPLKDGTVLCLGASDTKAERPKSVLPGEWARIAEERRMARRTASGPVTLFKDDFESRKAGESLPGVNGADEAKGAKVIVTDAVASQGKHSLALHDAPGLPCGWMPILERKFGGPKERDSGTVTLSFDVMMSVERPGQLTVTLRDYTQRPIRTPVTLLVLPDGVIQVNSKKVKAPNGSWYNVKIAFELGNRDSRTVKGTIKAADGGNETFEVPLQDPKFSTLTWLGIYAGAQSRAVMYVDDIMLKVEESP